jgi:hypothetical protein
MVSDRWLVRVGSIRGPRAFDDAPSNGKVYGGKDAVGRSTSHGYNFQAMIPDL